MRRRKNMPLVVGSAQAAVIAADLPLLRGEELQSAIRQLLHSRLPRAATDAIYQWRLAPRGRRLHGEVYLYSAARFDPDVPIVHAAQVALALVDGDGVVSVPLPTGGEDWVAVVGGVARYCGRWAGLPSEYRDLPVKRPAHRHVMRVLARRGLGLSAGRGRNIWPQKRAVAPRFRLVAEIVAAVTIVVLVVLTPARRHTARVDALAHEIRLLQEAVNARGADAARAREYADLQQQLATLAATAPRRTTGVTARLHGVLAERAQVTGITIRGDQVDLSLRSTQAVAVVQALEDRLGWRQVTFSESRRSTERVPTVTIRATLETSGGR